MTQVGSYPLVRDIALFVEVLRGQVPGLRYDVYARDDVPAAQCQTVYIVGRDEARALVGCWEMGVTRVQMFDTTQLGQVAGFFRYCAGNCRSLFVSNGAWERWQAYEETGKGLRKVVSA